MSPNPRSTPTYMPTAIDLFAGAGGLSVGLSQAGFKVIGAVELDVVAAETYKLNHGGVHIWNQDIKTLEPDDVMRTLELQPGQLDLLAGCPPCQGFSSMRTLNGARDIEDHRNDLVLQFIKFARELRPKAVMLENVPGLLNDRRFTEFCSDLKGLGYKIGQSFEIVNAADHGVPQRRRRLILMASLKSPVPFPKKSDKKMTVRQAIEGLPPAGLSGDSLHDLHDRRSESVQRIIRAVPKDGGSRADISEDLILDCHKRCSGFRDVYGRIAWDDVGPTITSGCNNPSKGRFIHPQFDRAITLREAAILQSFPKDYKFSMRRGKQGVALMIGNALPPELIRRHAKEIKKILLEQY